LCRSSDIPGDIVKRLLLALALLAAVARPVAAAGADDCEKIKDADAYNACLASFGPAVGSHPATQAPPDESVADAPRRHARKAAAPSKPFLRHASGRVRIEIYPGK
jgi:hypothetical protein